MKLLKNITTGLSIVYISLMSIAFMSVAITSEDESLRKSAIVLGLISVIISILLMIPVFAKAYDEIK
ncbi:hypothetical protein NIGALANA_236 [Bacillus phage Nigalana]|uniref:Uncharacterized protein n=1 Tax=Bacillus phage Megatron TaxID=1486661 RepID=A0A024B2F8_9CAUD|nr:hypothetical protein FP75_gp227 [Bacillus phage Megatron]YP_009282628.1 hypothetical protein BI005_gp236 [Bacillus phage Nigalana]YP_009287114.1 hypothetical protein BI006_gp238 [Bacillus phage Nemo]ASR78582.1 hypothetical protein BUBS_239 [Bacillus phage Bubs]ASR78865.1 hypothetical protein AARONPHADGERS_240 [Bacillus phage AaronPhadgers]ASR79146.1 hypothetical protein ZAINNY_238 [Bacillus phage Zainny]AXQ67396.1 hypothetical protein OMNIODEOPRIMUS_235 [Bacillus phage OmnioDeoPrimus]AHZ1